MRAAASKLLFAFCLVALFCQPAALCRAAESAIFDKGDNGLWMRRHWLHEAPSRAEIATLAEGLRAHGIRRIYPFLGPMDAEGWPGWRSKAGFVRYQPERAGGFLAALGAIAPEIRVLPWTGGIIDKDVKLGDTGQRQAFAAHARRLVEAGATGVHINIEPVQSGSPEFLELLRAVKAAIGARTLSVAAFPPPIPGEDDLDMHWDLPYLRAVCGIADEVAVMAYNTGRTSPAAFESLIAGWLRSIAATFPPRQGGGCEWLMGVPAYDDDEDYHRPDVETIDHSLNGIRAGLRAAGLPDGFRGVAIYASFTTDEKKWAMYDRIWRRKEPAQVPPPDPRNTSE